MKAKDIMTSEPIFLRRGDSLREAADELMNTDIRHIPVVEQGKLVGVVSDRDLQAYALPIDMQESDLKTAIERLDKPVEAVMRTELVITHPEVELGEVIDLMIRSKVGAIPVVTREELQLVGIVSYIDILKAIQQQ